MIQNITFGWLILGVVVLIVVRFMTSASGHTSEIETSSNFITAPETKTNPKTLKPATWLVGDELDQWRELPQLLTGPGNSPADQVQNVHVTQDLPAYYFESCRHPHQQPFGLTMIPEQRILMLPNWTTFVNTLHLYYYEGTCATCGRNFRTLFVRFLVEAPDAKVNN